MSTKVKFSHEDFVKAAEDIIENQRRMYENGQNKMGVVVRFLRTNPFLDDENIAYSEDKYPFSYNDYCDVFHYLYKQAGDKIESGICDIFPEEKAYFNVDGIRFTLRMLDGQGTALQLIAKDDRYKKENEVVLSSERQ